MNNENDNAQNLNDGAEEAAEKQQSEFISEFAPEPIQIPKYDKEKEQKKHEKANERMKKRNTKKSKKRRRLLRKAVFAVRTVLLFAVLFAVLSATLSSVIVKMNTSEYAIESAIRTHSPERFIVGKIKNPSKINLKKSSPRASVADVLRDNSLITVTYDDIEQAVRKSSYPAFVAKTAHEIIESYIHGKDFKEITKDDISKLLLENVSYIKLVTGVEIGESACEDIANYVSKSAAFKEILPENLKTQASGQYTYITSVLFSTTVLVCLLIALVLFLVLTAVACNGFAHKMIGWAAILSGMAVGVLGFLYKPVFGASSKFAECVIEALTKSFNQSSLIYGIVVLLVGILVMLIGHAMVDDEYEEFEEEDYMDDIDREIINAQ